jgi:hypothetical protein
MSIVLHIERLVLDQALLGDGRASEVRMAIEQELSQRLTQPGALAALGGLGAIAAAPVASLPPASPREKLGSRIASAVHGSLISGCKP